MAATVSDGVAVASGAASGAFVTAFDTWIDPWNPRLAAGVLLGSLFYLMQQKERTRVHRLFLFLFSAALGYIAASAVDEVFPHAPVGLIGCICSATIVTVIAAISDGTSSAAPGVVTGVWSAIKGRLTRVIGGDRD